MRWRERDGVRWLEADLPGARAVFSTRSAGSVRESPEPLASALGIDPERIAIADQVHGTDLERHTDPPNPVPLFLLPHITGKGTAEAGGGGWSCACWAGPRGARLRRRLPAGRALRPRGRGDPALRLARPRRRDRRQGGGGGRCDRRRDRPRNRPLLLRGGRRGARRVRRTRRRDRRGADARPRRGRPPPAGRGGGREDRSRRDVHELRGGAVLLLPPRRRAGWTPGGPGLDDGEAA